MTTVHFTPEDIATLSSQLGVPVTSQDHAEVATRLEDMFTFLAELDGLELSELVADMHFDPFWVGES